MVRRATDGLTQRQQERAEVSGLYARVQVGQQQIRVLVALGRRPAGDPARPTDRLPADCWTRHHNLTSWSPGVDIPFARGYCLRGQTVLAHHGLQSDRPSEAGLIAPAKRS